MKTAVRVWMTLARLGLALGGEKEIGSLPDFHIKIHRSNILPHLFFVESMLR